MEGHITHELNSKKIKQRQPDLDRNDISHLLARFLHSISDVDQRPGSPVDFYEVDDHLAVQRIQDPIRKATVIGHDVGYKDVRKYIQHIGRMKKRRKAKDYPVSGASYSPSIPWMPRPYPILSHPVSFMWQHIYFVPERILPRSNWQTVYVELEERQTLAYTFQIERKEVVVLNLHLHKQQLWLKFAWKRRPPPAPPLLLLLRRTLAMLSLPSLVAPSGRAASDACVP